MVLSYSWCRAGRNLQLQSSVRLSYYFIECDRYEFYRDCADLGQNYVIRAARNRAINKQYRRELASVKLFDLLESNRAQGKIDLSIQVNGKRKFRTATLSIICAPVSVPPPPNKTVKKDGPNLPMISLNAIIAVERNPPKNKEPLLWVLLTNMDVTNLDQAVEKVEWYSKRWNIETFHTVLKFGCGVEKAQLRTAQALKNYVIMTSVVAWRIFWLSQLREESGESHCNEILSKTAMAFAISEVPENKGITERAAKRRTSACMDCKARRLHRTSYRPTTGSD